MIDFLTWLDESNVAYLLMLLCFLIMARLHDITLKENIRLRKILHKAVLED